jgi:hypothetical protein
MCVSTPLKFAVYSVIEYIKVKSAICVACKEAHSQKAKLHRRKLWARDIKSQPWDWTRRLKGKYIRE